VNAFNRVLLLLVGLVMLAVGVLGVLVMSDVVEEDTLSDAIPYRDAWDDWNRIDWSVTWVRWTLLGAGVVVALLALALLAAELSVRRGSGERRVLERGPGGRTTVRVSALRRACERDAARVPGVERARVEALHAGDPSPRVRLLVRADERAHLPSVGAQVAERTASALGSMLGAPPEDVTVVMEVRHDRRAATRERRVE
jgi:hypothetical protein